MSTVGGNHKNTGGVQYTGEYHEYNGGYDKCGVRSLGNLYGNPSVLNIPQCTHDISPHSSWYRSAVLMVSPTVLNTPGVLMVSPQCTHDIPQCTHDIPQCTEHPPV